MWNMIGWRLYAQVSKNDAAALRHHLRTIRLGEHFYTRNAEWVAIDFDEVDGQRGLLAVAVDPVAKKDFSEEPSSFMASEIYEFLNTHVLADIGQELLLPMPLDEDGDAYVTIMTSDFVAAYGDRIPTYADSVWLANTDDQFEEYIHTLQPDKSIGSDFIEKANLVVPVCFFKI